ncbi:MAG: hypothetical protein H7233_04205, partial [Pseudorhodobacter sp.]|nr:hypothetical protein [Frankiaceae bacterium]
PVAPTGVAVTPRVVGAGPRTVAVTGTTEPDATVRVGVGALPVVLSQAGPDGRFRVDASLARAPTRVLPVTVGVEDVVGNADRFPAGSVDARRATTSLSTPRLSASSSPWGGAIVVTGRALRAGRALAATTLTVVGLDDRGAQVLTSTVRTAADGTWRVVTTPTRSLRLVTRYAGSTTDRPVSGAASSRLTVGAPGPRTGERPDTLTAVRRLAASPQGVRLSDTLRSGSDVDWFAIGVSRPGEVRVLLGGLPVDAALDLFDAAGERVATSDRSGRHVEEIMRWLPAGNAYVRVRAKGVPSATPYHLTLARLVDGEALLSWSGTPYSTGGGDLVADLLDNSSHVLLAAVTVRCVTSSGRVVRSQYWILGLLAPHQRAPFFLRADACPTGATMRVVPVTQIDGSHTPDGVRLAVGRPTEYVVTAQRYRRYPFRITNTGAGPAGPLTVVVGEYDAEGILRTYAGQYEPALASGASRAERGLDVTPPLNSPDRVRFAVLSA